VARAWVEDLVSGYAVDPDAGLTWAPATPGTGLVLVRDIAFASLCVHHLLPFVGTAHVAYLPSERLAGLSKIGRVVEAHARRMQIQERLTSEILGTVERALEPRGAVVVLEAEHTCMTLRGTRKEGSRLVTLAVAGLYERDGAARREVLDLLGRGAAVRRGSGVRRSLAMAILVAAGALARAAEPSADQALRRLALETGGDPPVIRIGMAAGHHLQVTSDRPFRVLDPATAASCGSRSTAASSPWSPREDRPGSRPGCSGSRPGRSPTHRRRRPSGSGCALRSGSRWRSTTTPTGMPGGSGWGRPTPARS